MASVNEVSVRLLNPNSTAAVVLGAHDWTDAGFGRAPSYLRSAKGIVSYLYDPRGLGLDPELVLDLFDDTASAGDQLSRVLDTLGVQLRERREVGQPVTDLLVYYVGHGHLDDHGQLSLLVRRSRKNNEAATGIRASDLAATLRRAAPQQRRSVVLDCCFAEAAARAFVGMPSDLNSAVARIAGKALATDQPTRGTLLLCSSPAEDISIGQPNAERTLFSGAVLEVLRNGAKGRPSHLSFADLRDAAFEEMLTRYGSHAPVPALHQPNAAYGDLTRIPAFPNRIATDKPTISIEIPSQSTPSDVERTIRIYDDTIALNSSHPSLVSRERLADALSAKANLLNQLNRREEALAVHDDIIRRFGNASEPSLLRKLAEGLCDKALTLYQMNNREQAVYVYNDFLTRFDNSTELPILRLIAKALANKGVLLNELERDIEAIAVYRSLLARFSGSTDPEVRRNVASGMYNMGNALGRTEAAVAAYDDVVSYAGTTKEWALLEQVAKAFVNKGVALFRLGRGEEAITAWDEVVSRFRNDSKLSFREQVLRAYKNKASALSSRGNKQDALRCCDEALAEFGNADEPSLQFEILQLRSLKARLSHF